MFYRNGDGHRGRGDRGRVTPEVLKNQDRFTFMTKEMEAVYERVFICLSWRKFTMALLFLSSLPTITPIPPPPPLPPPDSSLSCESQGFSTSAGTTRTLHNVPIKLLSSDASLCFCIYFLRSFLLRSLPQLFLLSFVLDFIAPLFPCALQLSGSLFTPGQTLKDQ